MSHSSSLRPCSTLHPCGQSLPPAPSPFRPTTPRTSDAQLAAPDSHPPLIFSFLRKESRGGPSRRGVALLRPEPLHRGTADTLLNRIKKLPCQITRWEAAGRRRLQGGRGRKGGGEVGGQSSGTGCSIVRQLSSVGECCVFCIICGKIVFIHVHV